LLEVLKSVPHIAGAHFTHEVDDVPALGFPMVEPNVLDRIDLERGVFVAVTDRAVIPQLPPAHAGLLWLNPLALEIRGYGDALGLGDVHR
jgi:hypothetical protein